ncbi:hypothetical protein, variant [Fonticula alba]|uniref:Uncharacterized protein n=1 Tax=Fonticula alba TaxID=691883 RepID=A0A058Z931_FONAL|nr:hypothetical protein, variant [Fonticula alba]KCV70002.1 hypothetical protein, variant [Fonticula alba]|eukprot:XP_009495608.1 hypothetical protein, variant [Fonticula alba]
MPMTRMRTTLRMCLCRTWARTRRTPGPPPSPSSRHLPACPPPWRPAPGRSRPLAPGGRADRLPCSDAETLSPRRRRSRLVLDGDIDQASAGAAPAGAPIAALDYDSTTRPFQLSDVALGPHADPMARTMVVLAGTGRRDARAGSDSDRSAGWWPPSDAEADSDLDDFIEHDTSSEEEHEEEGPAGDDQPGAGPVTSGRVGPFRTIDQYFRHGAGRAPRPRPALLAHFPYIRCLPPPHDTVGLFLFHRLYMALGFREVEDAERGASGDGDADVPSPHLHALRRALGTIRRRADTYRGSLVSSSTWRPDFELALRSFFDFDFVAPGGGAQTRAPIGRGARRALSDGIGAGYMCYACRRPHRGADPVIVRLSDRAVDGMPPGPEDPPPLREDLEGEHASNPGDVGHDGDHSDPLSPDVHDTLAGDLRRAARDALAESGRTLAPAAGPSDDGLPSSEATLFHVRIAADGREAEYLVGRQCAQRSDVYHRLVHLEQRLEHGIKLEVLRHRIDHPSAGRLELLDLISSDAEWLAAGRHQVADTLDAASAFRG